MSQRREARRREELFTEAFELTAEVSPSTLLRRVLDLAIELGAAHHGSLVLFHPDGEVQDLATSGVGHERRRLDRASVAAGVVGRVLREAEAVRLPALADDPSLVGFPRRRAGAPFLGLPVTLWGTAVGVLCLGRRQGAPEFDEDDEREMTRLGAQIGVALDHARLLQESRTRERALVAVKEVSQAILEGRPTDEVLHLVARSARQLADASVACVSTPDPTGTRLVRRAVAGARSADAEAVAVLEDESLTGQVLRSGTPLLVGGAGTDARPNQAVVGFGARGPALFVPLAVGDRMPGALAVANAARARAREFTADDVLLLQTFATEAGVALQRGRIHAELERLSLLEERERIAMDLHDGVIQALFVVGLSLQTAQEAVQSPDEVAVRLADAVGSIDKTIRDLRDYIFGLQPGELEDNELERTLRDVASAFQRSSGVSILVEVNAKAATALAPHAMDITHIAREALSNGVRHSGAGRISLSLRPLDDDAVLEVRDDGTGFDPAQAEGRGNGLVNLRTRAAALGGDLTIDSSPGAGTTVRLRVPVLG